jgi:hypothetical protein
MMVILISRIPVVNRISGDTGVEKIVNSIIPSITGRKIQREKVTV